MYLTLDSSVIVAGLREDEEKHEECRKLMEKVKEGEYVAFEPCTVLIEVAARYKKDGPVEVLDSPSGPCHSSASRMSGPFR
jgi:predicted nucleic acid-binding protein